MRIVTVLTLLLFSLPVVAQDADVHFDPQTYEPIAAPRGDAPPVGAQITGEDHLVELLIHLPEGSTKAVRFLDSEPHAALVQNGAAIATFTFSLPTRDSHGHENAVELDRFVFEHQPSDIFVDPEGLAFIALRGGGLHMVDVATPTDLITRGQTEEFDAIAVVAGGEVAFVGAGFSGLRMFDVSSPSSPQQIGSLSTGGSANGLHLEGTLLYVANGNPDGVDNLRIYNVSDPTSPQVVGGFNPPGFVTNVVVHGTVAFLSGAFGVIALDVTNPASPQQIDSFSAGGQTTFEVATHLNRLAVAGLAGIFVLDIEDPANMILIDSQPAGQGLGVDISRIESFDLALLGDRYRGAQVFRSHEGTYQPLSHYRNGGFSHKATFNNNRLYVTDLAGALRVFNVTDVGAGEAFQSARLALPSNTQSVLVRDGIAYVTDADSGPTGLTIVDVTTPSQPAILGSWSSNNQVFGLDLAGDVLFVANGFGGLTALDVSDPESPQELGGMGFGSNIVDVAVRDDVAFVVSFGGGLIAVDVSNPSAMEQISAQAGWGFLNAIAFAAPEYKPDIAYVADGQHGLRRVDISDPENMMSVDTTPTASQARDVAAGVAWDKALSGPVAYVADDFFGLRVFFDGFETASYASADRGIGVASHIDTEHGDLVALAAGETGVYIFRGPFFVSTDDDPLAGALSLDAVYPNPLNGSATVSFRLAEPGEAQLELFDILGRRVMNLAEGTHAAGAHEVRLDAAGLSSGVYVVRLTAAGQTASRRLTVVR